MLFGTMHARVFAIAVSVTLAARAHDAHEACAEEGASSTRASLQPGKVLVRGDPLPTDRAPTALARVLESPKDGQTVFVQGVVRRACERRGCWMELAPPAGGAGVRVTFKDEGFFVPLDSAGATARVVGRLAVSTLTAKDAEHLRSEGATVVPGSQREVRLVATGVELRRPTSGSEH
jgi:hypothetical protein